MGALPQAANLLGDRNQGMIGKLKAQSCPGDLFLWLSHPVASADCSSLCSRDTFL